MTQIPEWTLGFRHPHILGVGEAMLEFAAIGDGLYRRGFAGDTLNTCWHMAQILGARGQVSFYTRVGADPFSTELLSFIEEGGIDIERIARDSIRSLGLYVISLSGAERSFSYWRDASAARGLADDPAAIEDALRRCGLIHVSGITLAVIGAAGRSNLIEALRAARAAGGLISFDPNLRRRLWESEADIRRAMAQMFSITDIALPSFDDEASLWGDETPTATLARIAAWGVNEVVVKNGDGDVALAFGGVHEQVATPAVATVRDTTGAGDAFNAGYLAGRWVGMSPAMSCAVGQRVAAEVIGHFGAMAPTPALAPIRDLLADWRANS